MSKCLVENKYCSSFKGNNQDLCIFHQAKIEEEWRVLQEKLRDKKEDL